MKDINEIRFSGTIDRLQKINTKSGISMATTLLKVGQNKFKIVAFKNVADALLRCNDRDRVTVQGSGSINSWKDNEEHWHNDFQLTAWSAGINEQTVEYENANRSAKVESESPPLQKTPNSHSQQEYTGGPF